MTPTSGNSQIVAFNSQFQPLVVTVYDKGSNPVHDSANTQVTFQCSQPYLATFPGLSATATSPTVQGVATSPAMHSDNTNAMGSFQVTAAVPSSPLNPSVTFNEAVTS
ncbi:hypothetical protein CPB83DRAFT_858207 [Crepidotus variabilis]|uniref:Uncharacterized protein n=1 Tax=Crepidotus variabilis TaxID=179855 RepID=A0A9P6JMJ4_9AGAR|nr:hypothetical protein CPB83DRAFT_858207 [Crepidotus variabilis]